MLAETSFQKPGTKWLTVIAVTLICYVTGGNAVPDCNQTYVSVTFVEHPNTPSTTYTVLDVTNFCSNTANEILVLNGNDTQFVLTGTQLICTEPDAEARLSTDSSVYANPWTMTVTLTDAEGNFTVLTVFVMITSINDFPATMTVLSVPSVTDNTAVGTILGRCTLSDGDFPGSGDDIPYVKISSGNDDNRFAIDQQSCELRLIGSLNYNLKDSYSLTLKAYNYQNDVTGNSQTVIITVIPVNVYPRCSPFDIYIGVFENETANTILTTLNCTDFYGTNNVDYYRTSASNVSDLSVDQQNGDISLIRTVQYRNPPANNDLQITVDVVPKGKQLPNTTLTVHVRVLDVDNNRPQFTSNKYQANITAHSAIGTNVINLNATDADAPNTFNSKITFGFVTSCSPDLFIIASTTGSIYVNGTLSPSPTPVTCQVYAYSSDKASNKTFADLSITVIDDRNLPPIVSQLLLQSNVTENSNNGTFVMIVNATDPEGTQLRYSFPPGNTPTAWPFQIDSLSGTVTVGAAIDYETNVSYFGEVIVTDSGVPPLTASIHIGITVNPVNDFTPTFLNVKDVNVNRFDKPGTPVTTFQVSDLDAGFDGQLEYYLSDPTLPFIVDMYTGGVYIGIGLDNPSKSFYDLDVVVADKSKTNVLSSSAKFRVNVVNGNNNNYDPVCDPLGPLLVTPNKPNIGDVIGILNCTDQDSTITILRYDIVGGDVNNIFAVNDFDGKLRFSTTRIEGSYLLVVSVSDQGFPPRITLVSVLVNVNTDFRFTNLPTNINVFENSNLTDVLFTAKAAGAFDLITYEIISGNTMGKFHIHQTKGDVMLVTTLDREVLDSYTLRIRATSVSGQFIEKNLGVSVLDMNDNAPKYASSYVYLKIMDTVIPPLTLSSYTATDRDIQANEQIDYKIVSGDPLHQFSYNPNGDFSLISKLDYKTTPFYTIVLCATDRGVPSMNGTMIVYVEVIYVHNSSVNIVPSGGKVSITLSEDTAIGTAVAKIDVQNNDSMSNLNFTITSGNNGNNFTIDEKSGVVYLTYALDRESADTMNIGILVINAIGKTNTTSLVITITDVNDCDPVFYPDNIVITVPHGTGAGTGAGTNLVTLSVTDLDSGVNKDLTLSIISGDTYGEFIMSGNILQTVSSLSYNIHHTISLIIQAVDHGVPSRNSTAYVTILITPELNTPCFVPNADSISVEETRTPGSLLYDADATKCGATEPSQTTPGDLLYLLTGGDSSKFYVELHIGKVQLVGSLNYSTNTAYNLTITASNKYNSSLNANFTLTIRVTQINRYDPIFSTEVYTWSINEDASLGIAAGRVTAADKDPGLFGSLRYSIESNQNFQINPLTGVVNLISVLEYSIAKSYSLVVMATDDAGINSRNGFALVVINVHDMNNHAPVFPNTSVEVTVSENFQVGTVFQIVFAEDLDSGDNGTVQYSIISGNPSGIFNIDSKTGALSLKSSLDFESSRQYIIVVQGQDGGTPPLVGTKVVTINVADENDNKPLFTTSRLETTIKSDTAILTSICQVQASDRDSGSNGIFDYIIQSGNDNHLFSIDTVKGVILTSASLEVVNSFYTLIVEAVDHGKPQLTGTTTVAITVQPVQSPGQANYNFSVLENQSIGTLVGTIPKDTSLNTITSYIISGGNYGNAFAISKNANQDGVIRTNISLDRETYAYYQLLISVVTISITRDITVKVQVLDLNDNSPVSNTNYLSLQVVENLAAGYPLGKLTFTDADEKGINSDFDLYISPATPPATTYFSVDTSGAINLIKPISYEVLSSVWFYVVAKDRGKPSRSSSVEVYVKVIDVNETKLYNNFQPASYICCDFPDDSIEGDVVCLLTPTKAGINLASGDIVSYTIVGIDSIFTVHSSAGYLQVKKSSFISSATRYFQWVIITVDSGQVRTSYAVMVRLDTFNRNAHLISIKVNTDVGDLQSKQADLQAKLQVLFKQPQLVTIWTIRDTTSGFRRRKLLASQSEALAVVEADTSINNMSNIGVAKTFLTSEEAMKVLQLSSDGTPVQSLTTSSPVVSSVQPYNTDDNDGLDPAYIALIVVGCLVLIAIIIALIVYCACYRRANKGPDKKKLVSKKQQTKNTFANIDKSKRSEVKPKPPVKLDDPDADGMPIRPTTAVFITSSQTPVNASQFQPKKNPSTMLESLEETNEEDINDSTTTA